MNGTVFLEEGFHPNTIAKLKSIGHNMKADVSGHERDWFGRAQIIRRDRCSGVLCAGSGADRGVLGVGPGLRTPLEYLIFGVGHR